MKRHWGTLNGITKWKKPIQQDFMSTAVWHSEKHKTMASIAYFFPNWDRERMNRWTTEGFRQGSENTLYDTVIVNTGLCSFIQMHRMCGTKSEPWIESWTLGGEDMLIYLWVCQWCKNTTQQQQKPDPNMSQSGGVMWCWEGLCLCRVRVHRISLFLWTLL